MLSNEELLKLKKRLPKNAISKINKILIKQGVNLSRATISRVLNGKQHRLDVLLAAKSVVMKYEKELSKLKDKL